MPLRVAEAFNAKKHHWKILTSHFQLCTSAESTLYRTQWPVESLLRTPQRPLRVREGGVATADSVMITILRAQMGHSLALPTAFGFDPARAPGQGDRDALGPFGRDFRGLRAGTGFASVVWATDGST